MRRNVKTATIMSEIRKLTCTLGIWPWRRWPSFRQCLAIMIDPLSYPAEIKKRLCYGLFFLPLILFAFMRVERGKNCAISSRIKPSRT